ncbi:MAG: hypothetical protein CL878_04945 [Dehalococcoidia bacterium]|nr:hypothetical protein [Dehalococcoidia bacterium]
MMETDDTVRVGIVGAGGIVRQRHYPGLSKLTGVELVSVANSSPESTQRAAAEFSIPQTYPSWQDLVAADDTNAIVIGTQPYLHREITVAALDAGKHVFCQARMAMDYQDAKAMYERALASDRTTMLCPPPHYMDGDTTIRRLLRQGYVGPVYNVVVRSYNDTFLDRDAPIHWRQIGHISGFNTLEVGMLTEVLHRWLGYAKRVTAQTLAAIPERPSATGAGRSVVDRPDALTAVAELENGGVATFLFSGVARGGADRNSIEIYGADGALRYNFGAGHLYGMRGDETEWEDIPVTEAEKREWTAEADWAAAIRAGQWGSPSFWDGLKYMEATEAIFRAAETGRAQVLPFEALEQPARARAAIGM